MIPRSIRWQLPLRFGFVALLTAAILSATLLWAVEYYYSSMERARLGSTARMLSQMIPAGYRESEKLTESAQSLSFYSQSRIRVLDQDGTVLVDTGPRAPVVSAPAATGVFSPFDMVTVTSTVIKVVTATVDSSGTVIEEGSPDIVVRDEPFGYVVQPADESTEPAAAQVRSSQVVRRQADLPDGRQVTVEVSEGPAYSRAIVGIVALSLVGASSLAVLVAASTGWIVSKRMTDPLLRLTRASERMGRGDLAARAEVRRGDEIGVLARRFNGMAEQLRQSFAALEADRDTLRRFAADASHEMHTPITALRSFLELLGGPRGQDPTARAELLSHSLEQVGRMERLTRNLLDLSRFDAGTAALQLEPGDLCELVQGEIQIHRATAQSRGIALSVELPDGEVVADFDETYLARALDNLVGNALKFTPPGGHVTVGITRGLGSVEVWVQDSGPGIAPEDRPHIFELFYRGSAGRRSEGSGLGLAIVAAIAAAHGGRAAVESPPGGGSRFAIELRLPS